MSTHVHLRSSILVITIFQRGHYEPHSRNNWNQLFSRGYAPVFLRKPIATCDFPGGGGGTCTPLDPCL